MPLHSSMNHLVTTGLLALAEDEIKDFLKEFPSGHDDPRLPSSSQWPLPGPDAMIRGVSPITLRSPMPVAVTRSSVLWLLRSIVLVAKELPGDPIRFLQELSFDSFCLAYSVASSLHFYHTLELLLKSLNSGACI